MSALLFFHFPVMTAKLINESNSLIIAVSKRHGLRYSITFFVYSVLLFIWVCWILMAYASSTTYLLRKLPPASLYNYNGRQTELYYMKCR